MAKRPAAIGRYQIVDRIGQGGMGSLYRAWDPMLERQIAIKLLRDDNDELRERFAREARSAARLRHRNIVTIFDVGEQDGHPFIAMEFIQGQTLGELIRAGAPISTLRKLQIIDELCDGLAFAHKAGIVHRDVKPPNVMVEHDGTVKILDFGIVRLAESGMTQAGMLIGTVNYMSPEQVAGRPVDLRSDIFAVGAVFYELLACQQAFHGGLHNGILHRILHEAPRPLLEVCPDLDPDVVRIVDQALDKDPATRYQDLSIMRNDLQRAEVRLGSVPSDTGRRHIADSDIINLQAPTAPASRPATPRLGAYREDLARRRASQVAAHLEHAQQALANGEFEVVMAAAEQALLLDAEEPEALDLLERARSALEERQLHELLSRGADLLQAGAMTEAQRVAAEAVTLAPEAPSALRFQEAVAAARAEREGAQARAAAIEGALARARAGVASGALEAAAGAVAEALALAPELAAAHELREQVQQARARGEQSAAALAAARGTAGHEEAVRILEEALQRDPDHADLTGLLAERQAALEEEQRLARERRAQVAAAVATAQQTASHDAAIASLGEALRLEPGHAEARRLLTKRRAAREREMALEQEREAARRARERAKKTAAALAAARSSDSHAEAIQILEGALRFDAGHAELETALAERRAAREEERRLVQERRDKVQAAIEKARHSESHEEAIACLEAALELEPTHAEAQRLLTERRGARERAAAIAAALAEAAATPAHEAAVAILQRATALDPKDPTVREQLAARELALEQEREDARRARERAEKTATALASARNTATHEKAIKTLEAALRFDAGHAELERVLAERRAALDEERRARERRDKVRAAIEKASRSKPHQEAIAFLEQALELEPGHAEAQRLLIERRAAREREAAIAAALAEAQSTAGHEAALEILRRAAALDPTHQAMREQLAAREAALDRERTEARRARERAEKTAAVLASARQITSHAEAIGILQDALRLDPGHAELDKLLVERRAAHDEELRHARERRDKVAAAVAQATRATSHEEAIPLLERALALEPANAEAGRLLQERRSALEREREAQRRAREREAAIVALLTEARATDSHENALEILRRAAALDPRHRVVREQLAERGAAFERERDAARQALERAEKIAAAIAAVERTTSHETALNTLRDALTLDPDHAELRRLLAERHAAHDEELRVARERRDKVHAAIEKARHSESHEDAIGFLEHALELEPTNFFAQRLLVERCAALEREREAARLARERDAAIAAALAEAQATPAHEAAVAILQRAAALDLTHQTVREQLAAREASLAHERAEARKAQERRDRVATALSAARRAESHAAAISALEAALRLDPGDAELEAVLGRRRAARDEEIRQAEERRQRVAAAVAKAHATSSHAAAIEILQGALALDPAHAEVQRLLRERHTALEAEREAARQAQEREARITAAITKATATASHEKAVVILERAVAVDPADARLQSLLTDRTTARDREREEIRQQKERDDKLAAALKQAKRTASHDAALAILAEALTLDPNHREARALQATRQAALEQQRAEEKRLAELAAVRQTIGDFIDRHQFDEAATAIQQAKATLRAGQTLKDLERRLTKVRAASEPHRTPLAALRAAIAARLPVGRAHPLLAATAILIVFIVGGWFLATRGGPSQPPAAAHQDASRSDQSSPSNVGSSPGSPGAQPSSSAAPDQPVSSGAPPAAGPATEDDKPADPVAEPGNSGVPALSGLESPVVVIVREAQQQLARNDLRQAHATVVEGLKTEPQNPELRKLLSEIVESSRQLAYRARGSASRIGDAAAGRSAFRQGDSKLAEAAKVRRAQRQHAATLFWEAAALFEKAELEARQALARAADPPATPTRPERPTDLPPPKQEPTVPVTVPASPKPAAETPAPTEPRPGTAATPPPPKPITSSAAADEAAIHATLRAYAQGFSNRDAQAVKQVYPSVDVTRLARSFANLRAQDLKIQIGPITITGSTATVTCQVDQSATTREREDLEFHGPALFSLQKKGDSWFIIERR